MSSNDFNGPSFRPARGRGADENPGGGLEDGYGGGGQGSDGGQGAGGAQYPEPEGWDKDGFWSDPAIDSDYETGLTGAVRPPEGPREDPGYSYWADDKGWESSPGPGTGAPSADAPSFGGPAADATRATFQPGVGAAEMGAAGNPAAPYGAGGDRPDFYGGGSEPTAFYPGGPGGYPGGPGGPGGPGWQGPGGPGGPRGKRKGDWWRHWTWKKAVAVVGSAFVLFIFALIGVYYYLSSTAQIPAALASANYQDTTVYYSDGKTVLGTIGTVDRQDLTLSQIPKQLQDAVIAAEDRSFWTEGGISPTGILRSAYDDVFHGDTAGGSTITQEFVRNYYDDVGTQQTISRKVKEIFIAQKLSSEKSKQWILQSYMNLIPFGNNAYGVAAAAQTYFGVPVSKLTVPQDAVIAAIIQEPSLYWQLQYRTNLIARWHYVLNGMVTIGDLTQAQANAEKFPKLLTDSSSYTPPGLTHGCSTTSTDPWAAYLMSEVCSELTETDKLSSTELDSDGLKVVTTISLPMEQEMYKAVDENFAAIKQDGGTVPSYVMTGAELQDPQTGAIIAMYPGIGQNMSAKQCDEYDCDLNTAVSTREQVGSSFKPYVLSTAVAQGMNVQTSTLNSSPYLCVPPDTDPTTLSVVEASAVSGTCAEPGYFPVENDGGELIGSAVQKGSDVYKSSVQNAIAQSSNTAFTDLAHRVTTSSIIEMAQNYGVNISEFPNGSNLDQMVGDVGLALGTASLTVNEQATMLSTIADNGLYHASHIVASWQLPGQVVQTPDVASHIVLTPAQDSQVQYAMEMTTVDGTGTGAAVGLGDRQIIAKTGTTSSYHSGFFIGAIPQYTLVVGMFSQSQNVNSSESLLPLGGGGFGGTWPANIWNTFAQAEFTNLPMESFQSPVFTGATWNQVPKVAAPKKTTCTLTYQGQKYTFPISSPYCAKGASPSPSPSPSPTPTQSGPNFGGAPSDEPSGFASASDSSSASPPGLGGVGGDPNSPTTTPTPTPTAAASGPFDGPPN